jgi:hypothetical protein
MADEEQQQQKSQDSGRTANDKFRYWRPDPLHQWDTELIEKSLHAAQAEGSIYIGRDRTSSRGVHRPFLPLRFCWNGNSSKRGPSPGARVAIWQTALG